MYTYLATTKMCIRDRTSTYEELDAALLEWVSQVRSEGTPISGPIVAAKAKHFFEMLGLEGTFDASSGLSLIHI